MSRKKRVTVTQESGTGRNLKFRDNSTGIAMTRTQFVKKIDSSIYNNYHIRKINGLNTPVSNPDGSRNNNLD